MLAGMALAGASNCAPAKPLRSPDPGKTDPEAPSGSPPTILLNGYLPQSIYRIPATEVRRAKYPVIDVHCHGLGPLSLREMVKMMDSVGVERTVIFTGASTPERFAECRREYKQYPNRFELWCLFDLAGFGRPGFEVKAIKSLEECHRAGARGVGELSDKGRGFSTEPLAGSPGGGLTKFFASVNGGPTFTRGPLPAKTNAPVGPHADDPRLDALWEKAAQLGMPVSIHVSDPIWAYQRMDYTNDGLMNGWTWRIIVEPGMYDHDQLVSSLEKTAHNHPRTMFIACHLSNLDYDLTRLGQMFDRNPNLYADIAARFAETATIPRFVNQFLLKYPERVVYGTDVPYNRPFFETTFRILETEDEHFYMRGKVESANFNFNYHWTLNGFGLPDQVLKNIYHDNALAVFDKAQKNAG